MVNKDNQTLRNTAYSVIIIVGILLLVNSLFVSLFPYGKNMNHDMSDMPHTMESYVDLKANIIQDQIEHGAYRCCLENPCYTCAGLDPWHGEKESCTCLDDIVNGKAPCGECTGGILAGRGSPYLVEYFPEAIAEEVGMEHLDTIQQIINEKYSDSVEEH